MLGFYLMFNRNCAEAIETYKDALDAELVKVRRYSDLPPDPKFPIAEGDKDLILHAQLRVNGMDMMCADSFKRSTPGENMYVAVTTKDAAFVQKAWDVLKQDGEVYMELAPSFFASLHGSLRDKYGVNWMFSALKEH